MRERIKDCWATSKKRVQFLLENTSSKIHTSSKIYKNQTKQKERVLENKTGSDSDIYPKTKTEK